MGKTGVRVFSCTCVALNLTDRLIGAMTPHARPTYHPKRAQNTSSVGQTVTVPVRLAVNRTETINVDWIVCKIIKLNQN